MSSKNRNFSQTKIPPVEIEKLAGENPPKRNTTSAKIEKCKTKQKTVFALPPTLGCARWGRPSSPTRRCWPSRSPAWPPPPLPPPRRPGGSTSPSWAAGRAAPAAGCLRPLGGWPLPPGTAWDHFGGLQLGGPKKRHTPGELGACPFPLPPWGTEHNKINP